MLNMNDQITLHHPTNLQVNEKRINDYINQYLNPIAIKLLGHSRKLVEKNKFLNEELLDIIQFEKDLKIKEMLASNKKRELLNLERKLKEKRSLKTDIPNVLQCYLIILKNNEDLLNRRIEDLKHKDTQLRQKEFILNKLVQSGNKIHKITESKENNFMVPIYSKIKNIKEPPFELVYQANLKKIMKSSESKEKVYIYQPAEKTDLSKKNLQKNLKRQLEISHEVNILLQAVIVPKDKKQAHSKEQKEIKPTKDSIVTNRHDKINRAKKKEDVNIPSNLISFDLGPNEKTKSPIPTEANENKSSIRNDLLRETKINNLSLNTSQSKKELIEEKKFKKSLTRGNSRVKKQPEISSKSKDEKKTDNEMQNTHTENKIGNSNSKPITEIVSKKEQPSPVKQPESKVEEKIQESEKQSIKQNKESEEKIKEPEIKVEEKIKEVVLVMNEPQKIVEADQEEKKSKLTAEQSKSKEKETIISRKPESNTEDSKIKESLPLEKEIHTRKKVGQFRNIRLLDETSKNTLRLLLTDKKPSPTHKKSDEAIIAENLMKVSHPPILNKLDMNFKNSLDYYNKTDDILNNTSKQSHLFSIKDDIEPQNLSCDIISNEEFNEKISQIRKKHRDEFKDSEEIKPQIQVPDQKEILNSKLLMKKKEEELLKQKEKEENELKLREACHNFIYNILENCEEKAMISEDEAKKEAEERKASEKKEIQKVTKRRHFYLYHPWNPPVIFEDYPFEKDSREKEYSNLISKRNIEQTKLLYDDHVCSFVENVFQAYDMKEKELREKLQQEKENAEKAEKLRKIEEEEKRKIEEEEKRKKEEEEERKKLIELSEQRKLESQPVQVPCGPEEANVLNVVRDVNVSNEVNEQMKSVQGEEKPKKKNYVNEHKSDDAFLQDGETKGKRTFGKKRSVNISNNFSKYLLTGNTLKAGRSKSYYSAFSKNMMILSLDSQSMKGANISFANPFAVNEISDQHMSNHIEITFQPLTEKIANNISIEEMKSEPSNAHTTSQRFSFERQNSGDSSDQINVNSKGEGGSMQLIQLDDEKDEDSDEEDEEEDSDLIKYKESLNKLKEMARETKQIEKNMKQFANKIQSMVVSSSSSHNSNITL